MAGSEAAFPGWCVRSNRFDAGVRGAAIYRSCQLRRNINHSRRKRWVLVPIGIVSHLWCPFPCSRRRCRMLLGWIHIRWRAARFPGEVRAVPKTGRPGRSSRFPRRVCLGLVNLRFCVPLQQVAGMKTRRNRIPSLGVRRRPCRKPNVPLGQSFP